MLFINQQDLDDLRDEIEEDFGLKPPKNNSKYNKEKKETVEDRIINKCKQVQKACSSIIDELPYCGAVKKAIECKTGKDYITDEKLTPTERINRGVDVTLGIVDTVADAFGMIGPRAVVAAKQLIDITVESKKANEQERSKNRPKSGSKRRNRSRSRSRNRSRDKDRNKTGRKRKSQKKRK